MKEALSVFAGLLYLAAFAPYISAIVRKETKPAKASWLIWAVLDTIILAGMVAGGAVNGQIAGAAFGSWIVVLLATKHGVSGWTTLDKLCFGGALLAIVLWQVFQDPVLGIVTSLIAYSLGFAPTIASALKDSSRENKLAWLLFWVSSVCSLVAVPVWTVADAAQPVTFLFMNSVMMYILLVRSPALATSK
ncbi:MAG: hypothetical protein AAB701_00625 [Patescibacteria group bacterium]